VKASVKSKPTVSAPHKDEAILHLKAHIADVIHLHVLQSLALSQLQIELSRRMCEMGDDQQALAELDIAAQQLDEAAAVLQQIMHELGVPATVTAAISG
jgi:hypothetical protein